MENTFVGVSGINAVDNPGPGIGVARSLKEMSDLKVQIVGLAYDAMEPGIYMDWVVDKSFLLPYPSSSGEGYLDRLLYIKSAYGLDAVVPNLAFGADEAAEAIAEAARFIEAVEAALPR